MWNCSFSIKGDKFLNSTFSILNSTFPFGGDAPFGGAFVPPGFDAAKLVANTTTGAMAMRANGVMHLHVRMIGASTSRKKGSTKAHPKITQTQITPSILSASGILAPSITTDSRCSIMSSAGNYTKFIRRATLIARLKRER